MLFIWLHAWKIARFLETGDRGALVTNVEYRSKKMPRDPAFDWFTWAQANATLDRTLQQSLAYYDPEEHVLVFVFLLSKSGNSVGYSVRSTRTEASPLS